MRGHDANRRVVPMAQGDAMTIRVMNIVPPQPHDVRAAPDDDPDSASEEPGSDAEPPSSSGSSLMVAPGGVAAAPCSPPRMALWRGDRTEAMIEPADEPIGWRGRGPRSVVARTAPPTTGAAPAPAPAPPPTPTQPRRDGGERPRRSATSANARSMPIG
jgi:hypothetical protein